MGRWNSVSRHAASASQPSTVSISQALSLTPSSRASNAPCDLRRECGVGFLGADRDLLR